MNRGENQGRYVRRSLRRKKSRKAPLVFGAMLVVALAAVAVFAFHPLPEMLLRRAAPEVSSPAAAAASSVPALPEEPKPRVSIAPLPIAVRAENRLPLEVDIARASEALVEATVTVQAAVLDYSGSAIETRTIATRKVVLDSDKARVPLNLQLQMHGRTRFAARVELASVKGRAASPSRTTMVAGSKAIALTWDDGPSATTTLLVLKALRDANAHATFFVSGKLAERHPKLVKREAAEGNEIGSHGGTHTDLTKTTDEGLAEEVRFGRESILALTGQAPLVLRPPLGAVDDRVREAIREVGMEPILWDVDTMDWRDQDAALIEERVLGEARDGAIVLMHDSGGQAASTGAAAPVVIAKLQSDGYDLVTIEELKALRGEEELPSRF